MEDEEETMPTDPLADAFETAFLEEDYAAIRRLLGQGVWPHPNCLPAAVIAGNFEMADTLLTFGRYNMYEFSFIDALRIAIRARRPDMVELVLSKSRLEHPDFVQIPIGLTPLQEAVDEAVSLNNCCARKMVELLLEHGASPNVFDRFRNTPLHVAIASSNVEAAELSLDSGPRVNDRENSEETPLHTVGGRYTLARLLIDNGADPNLPNSDGLTPFQVACKNGDLKMVKIMKGADPLNGSPTALEIACERGSLDIIQYLVKELGADPNYKLPILGIFRSEINPRPLFELGMDPWLPGRPGTLAHIAIAGKKNVAAYTYEVLSEVFSHDPSLVNARCESHGDTPLHSAAEANLVDVIRFLVRKHNADLLAKDNFGQIPLITSVVRGEEDTASAILDLMVERNLDVDTANNEGDSALHLAIFHKASAEIINSLLDHEAGHNKLNKNGQTPLHYAGYPKLGARPLDSFEQVGRRVDISRILKTGYLVPPGEEDSSLDGLKALLARGPNAIQRDHEGNLPFFLAAAASRVTETFLIIRVAASQGLFSDDLSMAQDSSQSKRKGSDERFRQIKRRKTGCLVM